MYPVITYNLQATSQSFAGNNDTITSQVPRTFWGPGLIME